MHLHLHFEFCTALVLRVSSTSFNSFICLFSGLFDILVLLLKLSLKLVFNDITRTKTVLFSLGNDGGNV